MQNLKMQSPWVSHYDKIRELFRRDPEIKMVWDDDTVTLNMYIDNPNKAQALQTLIPAKKYFGNVVMTINIIPSNKAVEPGKVGIEAALEGNPLYHFTKSFPDAFITNTLTYVVFAKEVVQYYNDDLGDLYGNANCLPEDLARAVLENSQGLFFSTDIK